MRLPETDASFKYLPRQISSSAQCIAHNARDMHDWGGQGGSKKMQRKSGFGENRFHSKCFQTPFLLGLNSGTEKSVEAENCQLLPSPGLELFSSFSRSILLPTSCISPEPKRITPLAAAAATFPPPAPPAASFLSAFGSHGAQEIFLLKCFIEIFTSINTRAHACAQVSFHCTKKR